MESKKKNSEEEYTINEKIGGKGLDDARKNNAKIHNWIIGLVEKKFEAEKNMYKKLLKMTSGKVEYVNRTNSSLMKTIRESKEQCAKLNEGIKKAKYQNNKKNVLQKFSTKELMTELLKREDLVDKKQGGQNNEHNKNT